MANNTRQSFFNQFYFAWRIFPAKPWHNFPGIWGTCRQKYF